MRFKRIQRALLRTRATVVPRRCRGSNLKVTAAQAVALRQAIDELMSGYGDIAIALRRDDWNDARRLRWRYECLARLLDDLGWSEDEPPGTTITMPTSPLLAGLDTLSRYSGELLEAHRHENAEAEAEAQTYSNVLGACGSLRRGLGLVLTDGWGR